MDMWLCYSETLQFISDGTALPKAPECLLLLCYMFLVCFILNLMLYLFEF